MLNFTSRDVPCPGPPSGDRARDLARVPARRAAAAGPQRPEHKQLVLYYNKYVYVLSLSLSIDLYIYI